jgi:hypothetical protein
MLIKPSYQVLLMMGCKHREIQTRGEVDIENIKYELTLTLIEKVNIE